MHDNLCETIFCIEPYKIVSVYIDNLCETIFCLEPYKIVSVCMTTYVKPSSV